MHSRERDRQGPKRMPIAVCQYRLRAICIAAFLGGCEGPQSALDTAGAEAARTAQMFWVMLVGGALIWLAVMALAWWARRRSASAEPWPERRAIWLIVMGGFVVPTVVLAALSAYGLSGLLGERIAPDEGLRIHVTGERWWWRVRYETPGGAIHLANEIRLPLNRRTELHLETPDILHSFWVPALAGKIDLIPGRTTRLVLEPTRAGVFRGVCAEYCGIAHAHMGFAVEAMAPDAFARWLEAQNRTARTPESALARHGQEQFLAQGCGACHSVRGTAAAGLIGPDLTHLGSRRGIASERLPMSEPALRQWIADAPSVKPGALMPAFAHLREDELSAIASYLLSLE